MRNKWGSNQYRSKRKEHWKINLVAGIILLLTLTLAGMYVRKEAIEQAWAEEPLQSPYVAEVTTVKTELTEKEKIEQYVKEVFGDYYPQAKRILDCENHARNPKALNDNTKWGGRGKDWGIFQINDSWQGVTNVAFLTDYKININMAYNIFKSWGYNFHAWACSKQVGNI